MKSGRSPHGVQLEYLLKPKPFVGAGRSSFIRIVDLLSTEKPYCAIELKATLTAEQLQGTPPGFDDGVKVEDASHHMQSLAMLKDEQFTDFTVNAGDRTFK